MVHPPPPTYSSCGCPSSRCGSLAESIIIDFGSGGGSGNDDDDDNNNSTLVGSSFCSLIGPSDSCSGLTNISSINWNYVFNPRIDLCASAPPPCSPCLIGKVTQPKPKSYSKPTVTVWYNNEVYIYTCIYIICDGIAVYVCVCFHNY